MTLKMIAAWSGLQQSVVDKAIDHWQTGLLYLYDYFISTSYRSLTYPFFAVFNLKRFLGLMNSGHTHTCPVHCRS